jgi:hypothetical protein
MHDAAIHDLEIRLARFPRLGLAHLPTPLEPLKRLTAHLGGPRLWVKREDCTGLGFGGNKLRKLDYVLHEAVRGGADTLVSGGVVQSNSQRQVAAAAAKLGLACHFAVYHGRLAPPTADYETSGNVLLNRLFGATLHDVPWTGDRNTAIRALADRLAGEGRRPFVVLTVSRTRWGRWPMRRPPPRSPGRARRSTSYRRRSCTAPAAPAPRPAWRSGHPYVCRRPGWSASTSTPSRNGCGRTSSPTAMPRRNGSG